MNSRILFIFAIFCLILNSSCNSKFFHRQGYPNQGLNRSADWISESASIAKKAPIAHGEKFMVVSGSKLANEAAKAMIDKGGNAIDAMIAAELVLNVVEPQYSGIGGGGLLVYYDAKNKKTISFNGRETAPVKSNSRIFLGKDGKPREFKEVVKGGLSVGTPGLLKMFKRVHQQYGKLPWKDLFVPAIKIAQNGFKVDARLNSTANQIGYIEGFNQVNQTFLKKDQNGKYIAKDIGEVIINEDLAKTFKIIANQGIESFYRGPIANDIVNAVQHSKVNPGYLTLWDLKNYQAKEGVPVCGFYRKQYKICSAGLPSSGGVTLLQILGILQNFNLAQYQPFSKEAIHIVSEAVRLAYADRNRYLGDIKNAPIKSMLDPKYLKQRSELIKMDSIISKIMPGKIKQDKQLKKLALNMGQQELPSTTHLSIVDQEGNAASLTSSIEYYFGSGLLVDGFLLNNQLTDFSFIDQIGSSKVANSLAPLKQPMSSMTPTLVFDKNDNLLMVIGSPGGPRIIQFVLQEILLVLDWHLDPAYAISLPHYIMLGDKLELEKNTKLAKIEPDFKALKYNTVITDIVSGVNLIMVGEGNQLKGIADPRRDSAAALGF